MKKNNKISIALIILLYMMIYNPPIFSVNCIRILMVPSWTYLLFNIKNIKRIINIKKVLFAEAMIGLLLFYCITIAFINENSIFNFTHLFYWMFGDIPFSLCVWIYLKKRHQDFDHLISHIVIASFIFSITAILSLVSSEVKSFFTEKMMAYGVAYADVLSGYRNYGFAANLTSFTSMLQGILAAVCIYYGVKGNKLYLLVFPTIILSAIINTRSSIIFFVAGLFVIFVVIFLSVKTTYIFRYIIILIMLFCIAGYGLNIIQRYNPRTFTWITSGYEAIVSFVSGNNRNIGYFSELKGMTLNALPTGLNFILGVGTSVMGGSRYGARSDVGFINDLWRGGLIYSSILIGIFLIMLCQMNYSNNIEKLQIKFFTCYYFLIFILTNIKGSFFIHSDLTVVFWLIYTTVVFNLENKQKYTLLS